MNMEEDRLIEKQNESLSFIQQLQEQVTTCRRLLSKCVVWCGCFVDNTHLYVTAEAVETLELLLYPKLKTDEEYKKERKIIEEKFNNIEKDEYGNPKDEGEYNLGLRSKAKQKFKALMVFIDKMKYMPIEPGVTDGRR